MGLKLTFFFFILFGFLLQVFLLFPQACQWLSLLLQAIKRLTYSSKMHKSFLYILFEQMSYITFQIRMKEDVTDILYIYIYMYSFFIM